MTSSSSTIVISISGESSISCSAAAVREVWGPRAAEDAPCPLRDPSESMNIERLLLSLSETCSKCMLSRRLSGGRTTKYPQRPLSKTFLNNVIELAPTERLKVQARLGFPLAKPSFEKQ